MGSSGQDPARRLGRWLLGLSPEDRLIGFLMVVLLSLTIALLCGRKPWDTNFLEADASLRGIITAWMWIGAAFNAVLIALLLATARWWRKWARRGEAPGPPARSAPLGRDSVRPGLFWSMVLLAALILVIEAVPRLGFSLWNDEEYAALRNVFGAYVIKDGAVRLERPDWQETIWYYSKPTNHLPQTIASRVAMDLWLWLARPEGFAFREWVQRLPALLFGIAGVFLVAGMVRSFGGPLAGMTAAFLLAIHPWFVRFSSEARGYSLALAALIAALWALQHATRTAAWRSWLLYAGCLLLSLLAYPGLIYSMIFLNLIAVGAILLGPGTAPAFRIAAATRWFLSCALAGMAFLQVMAPCIPQLLTYLEHERGDRSMVDWTWVENVAGYLIAGVPFHAWNWQPGTVDLAHLLPGDAQAPLVLGGVVLALWLLGGIYLYRFRPAMLGWLGGILLGAIVAVALATRSTVPFWEWYVCQDLIPLVVLTACAMPMLAHWIPARDSLRTGLAASLCALLVAGYASFENPVHQLIRKMPVLPVREAILTMRGDCNPYPDWQNGIRTVGFAHLPRIYDPRLELVKSADRLRLARREAAATGQPLFAMIYARDRENPGYREIFHVLEGEFTLVRKLGAHLPYEEILVYEARPMEPQ